MPTKLIIRQLGLQAYLPIWQAMQDFTNNRDPETADEIWLVEHQAVFTQGQAGKEEHILMPGDIPVVKVDRGGQVTYHGPGQQMMYVLLNLKQNKLGVRTLVTALEQCVVDTLQEYAIDAYPKADAPGVYVDAKKVCSIGLRIRKGCSFHGLALNVNMDLSPFQRINPCGYAGLEMIDCAQLNGPRTLAAAGVKLTDHLSALLGIKNTEYREGFND
ncbi:lipoyl(octanoyl) transferase LipB [Paraglaciecola sp. MB-3u-78]|jgi:lipoyl(octanoyl) transferase|uniref:lipoyl(octanoyl) transferase LipB n=1 Tax=Paraglaciecola sp. MB-3u-78 TaxID=2058332 RepID=UPI000C33ED71|nr:lipoyl(octanoyl) transferase LipB [Paraglaciecola sp. MB-3u-78]PKG99052.1 octanoyltransferase [Paraglaciecola sp. MB-3u-78]